MAGEAGFAFGQLKPWIAREPRSRSQTAEEIEPLPKRLPVTEPGEPSVAVGRTTVIKDYKEGASAISVMSVSKRKYTHTHTHARPPKHTHTPTHAHTQAHTLSHEAHTHTHTHTHVHTSRRVCKPFSCQNPNYTAVILKGTEIPFASGFVEREIECLLYDSHQKGKIICGQDLAYMEH